MYERYYIQLGNFGNFGIGSVFAVTADNPSDAIEEAAELAAAVAPGLFADAADAAEFPDDYIETENGPIACDELRLLYHVSTDRGAGKFHRPSRYIPNNYRFGAILEAVAHN